jgi:16S rRNA G966 N2-methylase RsmD
MCSLIEANLELCRIPEDQATVVLGEATDFLKQAAVCSPEPFDIVFFDPPYKDDYVSVLHLLGANAGKLIDADSLLIVEHYHKNQLPGVIDRLTLSRVLKQGDSALSFYQRE